MRRELIDAINLATSEHRPVVFVKRLTDGTEYLLPDVSAPALLNEAAARALVADKTSTQIIDGEPWFIEARNPAPRLVVVGAVHIAQSVAPLAALMGFAVIIADPRRSFATAARFPDVEITHDWPDAALDALQPDQRTAVVTLTHDPKLDDPALDRALRSEAFYVGALGSRKSHAARLERLRALGHDEATLNRVRGPVGLAIGAVSASEIALSIIAELVAVRRHGRLLSLVE